MIQVCEEMRNRSIEVDELKDAIYYFNKCLDIDPSYAGAYSGRGYSRWVLGDKNGGCEDMAKGTLEIKYYRKTFERMCE